MTADAKLMIEAIRVSVEAVEKARRYIAPIYYDAFMGAATEARQALEAGSPFADAAVTAYAAGARSRAYDRDGRAIEAAGARSRAYDRDGRAIEAAGDAVRHAAAGDAEAVIEFALQAASFAALRKWRAGAEHDVAAAKAVRTRARKQAEKRIRAFAG